MRKVTFYCVHCGMLEHHTEEAVGAVIICPNCNADRMKYSTYDEQDTRHAMEFIKSQIKKQTVVDTTGFKPPTPYDRVPKG